MMQGRMLGGKGGTNLMSHFCSLLLLNFLKIHLAVSVFYHNMQPNNQ